MNLQILNAGKDFNPKQVSAIHNAYKRALRTCKKLISVNDADVLIYHNPKFVMSETDIGGSTPTTHLIDIPVDAKAKLDYEILYLTICHEMHHAMRQRKFGFPKTLFDAVVSEGLADQFEREINPDKPLLTYRKDIDKKTLRKGLEDLKKELNKTEYDYFGWFFGQSSYPKYFGYTLGSIVLKAYFEDTQSKPSELVNKQTDSFAKYIDKVKNSL